MLARIACQDTIPRIYSGHANTAKPQSTLTITCCPPLQRLRNLSNTVLLSAFQNLFSRPCRRAQVVVLHPPPPPDSSPPQTLLTPQHAWARKWVPNAHAMQIASQAPRRYAGDPRRRWGLLGGEFRGAGSGGLGTSPNGPLDMTRSSPKRALRPRTRDFSRPSRALESTLEPADF
jgi:hypothetical protein